MRQWVKLWTEILDDPKMGRLSDRQFRTCINLFALAGRLDMDGTLASTEDVAYYLRMSLDDLKDDLAALTRAGIIYDDEEGIIIVAHFAERNSKPPSAAPEAIRERVARYRAGKSDGNEDVTSLHQDGNAPRIDKNRIDTEKTREEEIPLQKPQRSADKITIQQAMFGAVADTCKLDAKLKRPQIAQTAKKILKADYTVEQVRMFAEWWSIRDWRGQKGQAPTTGQLLDLLPQSIAHRDNGTGPLPDNYTLVYPEDNLSDEETSSG